MRKVKRPAAVFNAAANAIEKHGHCRGLLKSFEDDSMCIYGAISFVMCGDPLAISKEAGAMLDRLRPFVGNRSPVAWNNEEGRTKRQVVNLLRKAAKAERAGACD